jgi:hypothetical protein
MKAKCGKSRRVDAGDKVKFTVKHNPAFKGFADVTIFQRASAEWPFAPYTFEISDVLVDGAPAVHSDVHCFVSAGSPVAVVEFIADEAGEFIGSVICDKLTDPKPKVIIKRQGKILQWLSKHGVNLWI